MKVLIDEGLPRFLIRVFPGHQVESVEDAGWSGMENGELLNRAELSFDLFLTEDKNLRYQQNLVRRGIAVLELPGNTLSVVKALVPKILEAMTRIKPGDYIQVTA